MLVRHLVLCNRQVMRLVMRTAHKQPDEAETADVGRFLGVVRRDRQAYAVGQNLALQPFI